MALPKYIHPIELADRGAELKGTLKLKNFTRVSEIVAEKEGEINVALKLGKDIEGIRYLNGTITGKVELICQRCLKTLAYPIEIAVQLSPVYNEAAAQRLPERYEPLIITEDTVLLADIIEEELLLALPMIPKHEESQGQCETN